MSLLNITRENYKDFDKIIGADKPVVVEFSAPWCVYCRRLEPAIERTAEKMNDVVTIATVNIDDVPEIAEEYGVDTIPALMLFKKGEVIGDALIGPPSQNVVETWIKNNL